MSFEERVIVQFTAAVLVCAAVSVAGAWATCWALAQVLAR